MTAPQFHDPYLQTPGTATGPVEVRMVDLTVTQERLAPDPDAAIPDVVPAGGDRPVPVMSGTFAIYREPDGSIVLVTDVSGHGVERRRIPGKIIKLVTGSGPLGRLFSRVASPEGADQAEVDEELVDEEGVEGVEDEG